VRLVTFVAGGRECVGCLRPKGLVDQLEARSMIEWLAGDGHDPDGVSFQIHEVRLLAPVPSPPSVRDFYAYEGHVRAGFALRGFEEVPAAWYEAPR